MSLESLETPFSPLKIVFPEFSGTTVLPHDIDALKTLLQAQKKACEQACQAAYQTAVQSIRQEAQDYVIRMIEQAVQARRLLVRRQLRTVVRPRAACSMKPKPWRNQARMHKTLRLSPPTSPGKSCQRAAPTSHQRSLLLLLRGASALPCLRS